MQRTRWLAAAVMYAAGAYAVWAQSGATVSDNCANHLNTSADPEVSVLLSCLADMHRKIDQLEQDIADTEGSAPAEAEFPSGAVVAFDGGHFEKGRDGRLQSGCPDGWIRFEQAAGRFLLGSDSYPGFEQGSPKYRLRDDGGEEMHTLTLAEIPPHDHGGIFGSDGSKPRATNDHRNETAHNTVEILMEGGGQPHNNMPPYIALYFCKKQ